MDMTEIERFEQQTKRLKLSDAMRIGAKIRPQAKGEYFVDGGSCAIGAAMEAYTGRPIADGAACSAVSVAIGGRINAHITDEIAIRNDRGESRESIANWLESQGY